MRKFPPVFRGAFVNPTDTDYRAVIDAEHIRLLAILYDP
jgi:hypothetical protein